MKFVIGGGGSASYQVVSRAHVVLVPRIRPNSTSLDFARWTGGSQRVTFVMNGPGLAGTRASDFSSFLSVTSPTHPPSTHPLTRPLMPFSHVCILSVRWQRRRWRWRRTTAAGRDVKQTAGEAPEQRPEDGERKVSLRVRRIDKLSLGGTGLTFVR